MPQTVRIAMWSGPRNISTALMRSWEARADCEVIDEPFYAAYLAQTGLRHPMHTEIQSYHPTDWGEIAEVCAHGGSGPIVYQKHMTQHMVPSAPTDWMGSVRHAFLIRPPAEVAASFAAKMEEVTAEDLGFRRQAELYETARVLTGYPPPVIEARDVLENPDRMLRRLCAALDVVFDPAMLSWKPGRRSSDGIWAAHWYGAVERSTGFEAPRPSVPAPVELRPVIDACLPFYERMAARKLSPA